MAELPIVIGPQGPVPTTPAQLRAQLIALVSATRPDYTANLPGSLVEDIVSTDVGALVIANQFLIDLINSVSPYYANPFILTQLGVDVYGIQPAQATNTAVDVIFLGTPGFIIIPGFTVTDGIYQYICTEGGVIGTNQQSLPIHAIASVPGTWAVPAGSVNGLITSVPQNVQLTCINPNDGIPSVGTETQTSFRTRTLVAGLAASTGMDRYLKTLLWNIPGVVQRLVSVRIDTTTNRYLIFCGGGDPYQVAWAIYYALFDIQSLEAPNIDIINITNSNPALITTATNHNLTTGMTETFEALLGMELLNDQSFEVTVTGPNTFTIDLDTTNTTTYDPYISGGFITPNPILQKVYLNSYPDTYLVPFILPAQQYVNIVVTWNTDSPNYVSPQAIAQAAGPAIVDYINSLYVGISPINTYDMIAAFMESIFNIVPRENITVLTFTVSFDGSQQFPVPGTGVIYGDPNSYFFTDITQIEVVQG
jgi:Ubiquitin-activating enzyme E1 FCCH domain